MDTLGNMKVMYEVWYSKNGNPYPNDLIYMSYNKNEALQIAEYLAYEYDAFNFFVTECKREILKEHKNHEAKAKTHHYWPDNVDHQEFVDRLGGISNGIIGPF